MFTIFCTTPTLTLYDLCPTQVVNGILCSYQQTALIGDWIKNLEKARDTSGPYSVWKWRLKKAHKSTDIFQINPCDFWKQANKADRTPTWGVCPSSLCWRWLVNTRVIGRRRERDVCARLSRLPAVMVATPSDRKPLAPRRRQEVVVLHGRRTSVVLTID